MFAIDKHRLIIRLVLVPSSSNIRPHTLLSSYSKRKIPLSVGSWRVSSVLTLNTQVASNVPPSIVHGLRRIQLPHDRTSARNASKSTASTQRVHLQRAKLLVGESNSRTPTHLLSRPSSSKTRSPLLLALVSPSCSWSRPSWAVWSLPREQRARRLSTSDWPEETARIGLLTRAMRCQGLVVKSRAIRSDGLYRFRFRFL